MTLHGEQGPKTTIVTGKRVVGYILSDLSTMGSQLCGAIYRQSTRQQCCPSDGFFCCQLQIKSLHNKNEN